MIQVEIFDFWHYMWMQEIIRFEELENQSKNKMEYNLIKTTAYLPAEIPQSTNKKSNQKQQHK